MSKNETLAGLPGAVGDVGATMEVKQPHELMLEKELERVSGTTTRLDLKGLEVLLGKKGEKTSLSGQALATRVNDLYHSLYIESVPVLNSETGELGLAHPNINIDMTDHLKMDKKATTRQAENVVNAVTSLVEHEILMGMVATGKITSDQLRSQYAGLTAQVLEQKIVDMRQGLNKSTARLYRGLTGQQMQVERHDLKAGKVDEIKARSGSIVVPVTETEDPHVWVVPADRFGDLGVDPTAITRLEEQTKRTRKLKRAGSGLMMLITAACSVSPGASPAASPVTPENVTQAPVDLPEDNNTAEPTKAVTPAPPVMATATPEGSTPSGQEAPPAFVPANNPPEYTNAGSGGPVSESWKSVAEINGAWARYSVPRSKGELLDPVLSTEDFVKKMSGVEAKVFQVESPDGNQMVSVAVTEDVNKNQTFYYGVDKKTKLPTARPDVWMFNPDNFDVVARPLPEGTVYGGQWGEDENYYSFAVDAATGKALYWFDTTKGAGEWVKLEKVYTSCVDQDLQAEMDATFKAKTGMTVGEAFVKMESQPDYHSFVTYNEKTGLFRTYMMYVGAESVSIEHLTGGEGDYAVCGYFVQNGYPEIRVPIVLGLRFGGNYESMILTSDYTSEPPGEIKLFNTRGELMTYLEKNVPLGSRLAVETQSFANAETVDSMKPQVVQLVNLPGLVNFWKLTVSDYLKRMRGVQNPQDVLAGLDPAKDVGVIGFGLLVSDVDWMKSK